MTSRFNKKQTTTFVPKKSCRFCVEKGEVIDYKDPKNIQKYISSNGKIEPRKKTGLCLKHQRKAAKAIKRARIIALLPFVNK